MRVFSAAVVMFALLQAGAGCRRSGEDRPEASKDDSAGLESRVTRLNEALAKADSGEMRGKPVARWLLPPELSEVSGLALTPDGRLFAHNDESARITELDYRRGTVIKQFFVGKEGLRGDFEGLAYARDRFFLLSSDGTLYEFREGADKERVEFTAHDTHLGRECEFEGVAFDSTANALVLACKNVAEKKFKDMLVLYRYSLWDSGGARLTELTVPQSDAIGKNPWKQFRPTDITVDPYSGNYVLVAAQERGILAVTPAGAVVFSRLLEGRHPQAEGIAITRDSILIIGDESIASPGTITLYHWH
jgi:uncharacterized protein YjiK